MRSFALFLALLAFWLLLSGHFEPLLLGQAILYCGLVTALARRMKIDDEEAIPLAQVPRFCRYLPWLIWQIVVANWQVARLVWSPSLPIDPVIVRQKHGLRTPLGKLAYANSITLTPGTVTIEITDDDVLIHALTRASAEDLARGEMERRVARIEGAAR